MTLVIDLFIFVVGGMIEYVVDVSNNKYDSDNSLLTHTTLLFHHIISFFGNFGWISSNKVVLAIFVLSPAVAGIHWHFNEGECCLSKYINKVSNKPKDHEFKEMSYILGMDWKTFHVTFYPIFWFIGFLKLIFLL